MKTNKLLPILIILFIVSACNSSKIITTWKSPNTPILKYNKILVVGINGTETWGTKEKMERELVDRLKEKGQNAVSASDLYGPKAFRNLSEDTVLKRLVGTTVDAVLTIVLLNKTKEKYYVPARVYYSPYTMYHHHFWGYYNTMTARIYSPGYYTYDKKYFWESNLYDMKTKELIYSVQTESFNPNSSEQLAHEYSDLIIINMEKNKVINF